jgi:tRNA threonylcarbamoyl adenosine modification protein YjeE
MLRPGDVVVLRGGMGAGKTTFVRAVVAALHGSDDAVASPTFTFRHTYEGTPAVEHLDLYRVGHERELDEIGIDEAFGPASIAFVEWPEIAGTRIRPTVAVTIAGAGDEPRTLAVERIS